jgi:putative N6-adenine-specific DNA methylase
MSRTHDFYAVTPPGLETIAAMELSELAAHDIALEKGGIAFSGTDALMARVNLRARTLTRVLMRLDQFKALSFPELYNKARRIDWSRFVPPGAAVSVQAACHGSRLLHSGRVEETVAAAIADRLGHSPASSTEQEQQVYVRIDKDVVTVSLDSSGDRLDRRGYRLHPGHAPLRESIAAALLLWANWEAQTPLMVPMCGAGTLAIEAAWIAMRRAPNLDRRFPYQAWPSMPERRWQRVLEKAGTMQQDAIPVPIHASDLDTAVLEVARANAEQAQVSEAITFSHADVRTLQPVADAGLIICNPPYGQRLGHDARRLYREIGRRLQEDFGGWQRIVLVPDTACTRALGLPVSRRLAFRHGGQRIQALDLG